MNYMPYFDYIWLQAPAPSLHELAAYLQTTVAPSATVHIRDEYGPNKHKYPKFIRLQGGNNIANVRFTKPSAEDLNSIRSKEAKALVRESLFLELTSGPNHSMSYLPVFTDVRLAILQHPQAFKLLQDDIVEHLGSTEKTQQNFFQNNLAQPYNQLLDMFVNPKDYNHEVDAYTALVIRRLSKAADYSVDSEYLLPYMHMLLQEENPQDVVNILEKQPIHFFPLLEGVIEKHTPYNASLFHLLKLGWAPKAPDIGPEKEEPKTNSTATTAATDWPARFHKFLLSERTTSKDSGEQPLSSEENQKQAPPVDDHAPEIHQQRQWTAAYALACLGETAALLARMKPPSHQPTWLELIEPTLFFERIDDFPDKSKTYDDFFDALDAQKEFFASLFVAIGTLCQRNPKLFLLAPPEVHEAMKATLLALAALQETNLKEDLHRALPPFHHALCSALNENPLANWAKVCEEALFQEGT